GWSVGASDVGNFTNCLQGTVGCSGPSSVAAGQPIYSAPYSLPSNIAQPGTQFFDIAAEVHFKDPIVEEWDLTLEQDLGKGVGLRASYDGNHGYNIPTLINLD